MKTKWVSQRSVKTAASAYKVTRHKAGNGNFKSHSRLTFHNITVRSQLFSRSHFFGGENSQLITTHQFLPEDNLNRPHHKYKFYHCLRSRAINRPGFKLFEQITKQNKNRRKAESNLIYCFGRKIAVKHFRFYCRRISEIIRRENLVNDHVVVVVFCF